MTQRNDLVFQLSLTELAFTITFIVLLLLGYLVFKEQTDKQEARAKEQSLIDKATAIDKAAVALANAKSDFASALKAAGSLNPDEAITRLIAAEEVRAERDRMKQRIEDLDLRLTSLTELQQLIENTPATSKQGVTAKEVASALAFQQQFRKVLEEQPLADDLANSSPPSRANCGEQNLQALLRVKEALVTSSELKKLLKTEFNQDLKPGQEAQTVQEIVVAAKKYGELAKSRITIDTIHKENSDLRGQVAFLKNRLDARGGRDFPPCWADENGKIEFLFAINLRANDVVVSPAWPAKRESDAQALPDIKEVLAEAHSHINFQNRIQRIFDWSKRQDPECRHYVQLRSSIPDAVQSDRARLMVENYFYKVEVRR